MMNIIIYTLCGLGIGFSLGMLAAAVLVDRRRKKIEKERLNMYEPPFCYMDNERGEDWME